MRYLGRPGIGGAPMKSDDAEALRSLLLPVVLTLALIVLSAIAGLIDPSRLWFAAGAIVLLIVGVNLTLALSLRRLYSSERGALFKIVSSMAFSDHQSRARGVLTREEVLAIEATAREVWIYAYDLAWEDQNSPFQKLVRENVGRGVKYRYLLPQAPEVLLRAKQVSKSLKEVRDANSLVKFRSTVRERLITQFGMAIYNPTFLNDGGNPAGIGESVIVFFPHFKEFSSADDSTPFLALTGAGTARVQEAFVQYWDAAEPIEIHVRGNQ